MRGSGWAPAFAGMVAVGAALAVGELLAGIFDIPSPGPRGGPVLRRRQPPGAKDLVVALFGTADKLAFEVLIIVVALGIRAVLGRVAVRRPMVASSLIIAFAVAGFLASLREPNVVWTFAAAAAAGIQAAVGIEVLRRLLGRTTRTAESAGMPDWRRQSLLRAGGCRRRLAPGRERRPVPDGAADGPRDARPGRRAGRPGSAELRPAPTSPPRTSPRPA